MGLKDCKASLERPVYKVPRVRLVRKGPLERLARQGSKESKVPLDRLVLKAFKVPPELLVLLVRQDRSVHRALRVVPVRRAQLAPPDLKAILEALVPQALKGPLDLVEPRDKPARKGVLESPGLLVPRDPKVYKVPRDRQVRMESGVVGKVPRSLHQLLGSCPSAAMTTSSVTYITN